MAYVQAVAGLRMFRNLIFAKQGALLSFINADFEVLHFQNELPRPETIKMNLKNILLSEKRQNEYILQYFFL
jgi:hypothetical protein